MNSELSRVKKSIEAHRKELRENFAVKKIGVFGSVAKGFAGSASDVDILVDFKKPVGLFIFAELKLFLEDILNKKVDLATPRALKSLIRDEVMNSVVYI